MLKALSLFGLVVAIALLIVFGLDLATGMLFYKVSMFMDVAFVICSAALGYLSWTTFREQR